MASIITQQYRRGHRLDVALSTNLPVALVFLPASDIALYVAQGRCVLNGPSYFSTVHPFQVLLLVLLPSRLDRYF